MLDDTEREHVGLTIDVRKAHKSLRLHPAEWGLMFFAFQAALYFYKVCHFGGRWSDYWWKRMGARLHRDTSFIGIPYSIRMV